MFANWLAPVERCCCTPGFKPNASKDGGNFEEINLYEAQMHRGSASVPGTPIELHINTARERAGFRHAPPPGPAERAVPTFATSEVDELQGEPLQSGKILQLTLGESIQEVSLALYPNGFSLVPCDKKLGTGLKSVSRAWSPFSLVEKCQVKAMQQSAFWAVFKLTVFRKEGMDRCYYFATTGADAHKERERWVQGMVDAISNVTLSLFPRRAITVEPLPDVSTTSTRIMAGYLLQSGPCDNVSLFYCELHAYSRGKAHFIVYHDEWCEQEVCTIKLADSTTVSTRKGTYCTVFGIDGYRFSARTKGEKDLWVRAVSNIKVKLMFDAPDPSGEELQVFRSAIHERLGELPREPAKVPPSANPLLPRVPRMAPLSPRGDMWPDPVDETSNMSEPTTGDQHGREDSSIEDIDEPEGGDVAPPNTLPAYFASPQAGAEEVTSFGTDTCTLTPAMPDTTHGPTGYWDAKLSDIDVDINMPPKLLREMPRVTVVAAVTEDGSMTMGERRSQPLCSNGCLSTPSLPAGSESIIAIQQRPPGLPVTAEPPHDLARPL